MDKPVMKTDAAIRWMDKTQRIIHFYATSKAIVDISTFGELSDAPHNSIRVAVDARFDFDEVVAYIKGYGKDAE